MRLTKTIWKCLLRPVGASIGSLKRDVSKTWTKNIRPSKEEKTRPIFCCCIFIAQLHLYPILGCISIYSITNIFMTIFSLIFFQIATKFKLKLTVNKTIYKAPGIRGYRFCGSVSLQNFILKNSLLIDTRKHLTQWLVCISYKLLTVCT